ncbi:hypothetical protein [Phormidium sp. CCY1219]|nr:hypothetical protein [Phormidium sp. CCY1219]
MDGVASWPGSGARYGLCDVGLGLLPWRGFSNGGFEVAIVE